MIPALLAATFAVLPACPPPWALGDGDCLLVPSAAVVRVYDGDTLTVRVEEWPPIFRELSFRLEGYDAPELRGQCLEEKEMAREARDFLAGAVREAREVVFHDVEPGKYFRLVGRLRLDGRLFEEDIVGAGLARDYDGGTREGWCD